MQLFIHKGNKPSEIHHLTNFQ